MVAGSHGSTFGGNPLAMAVGNAVLDVILADGFLDAVRDKALRLKQKLAGVADAHPDIIETVRGEGLMLGLKCKVPNTDLVAALCGQHMLAIGGGDNVVRLLPPLIVGDEELDEAVTKVAAACAALEVRVAAAT
jgi:acetylornithine/N-succinyldiaminopimelate aminotransferase